MRRALKLRHFWLLYAVIAISALMWVVKAGFSQQPTASALGVAPPAVTPTGPVGEGGGSSLGVGPPVARPVGDPTGEATQASPSTQTIPGGEGAFRNAPDVADLLIKSTNATGIEIQQRNTVTSDPRVRGFHVGQLTTYVDGGFFFPARQDLDTAVSKIDSGSVSNILVLKGPYSVRYGPGFSFLDIATYDPQRSTNGGFEFHGRSFLSYQTNGRQWEGLQMINIGAPDWGFRATYDIRTGQDYTAGNDQVVPSEYNSQNFNFALGYYFSDDSQIVVKALRQIQHNVEFPGLFFDINRLDTEAYSLRYTLRNQTYFDVFNADAWYNFTSANGDTHRGAKQAFINSFLSTSFSSAFFPNPVVQDFSSTNFNELSSGYRFTLGWGKKDTVQLAIGTDMNVVRQALAENILILNNGAVDPSIGPSTNDLGDPFLRENLGLPQSQLVDPGIFIDGSLPLTDRVTAKAGARVDFVRTSAQRQIITGNFIIIPGTLAVPGTAPVAGVPPTPDATMLDPLIYSATPNDPNLERHFLLWSAYASADYKIDEHLTLLGNFAVAQRPPTLTELYAAGPFVAVLQQGLNRLVGDPHLNAERDTQFDVGINADYGWFRGGATGFYAWIDNYITFDRNRSIGTQLSQVVFTNTDLATLAGGEAFAEVDVLSWLTPFVIVSFVQGQDLSHVDSKRPDLTSARRSPNLNGLTLGSETEPLPGIPPLELRSGVRLHEPTKTPRYALEFMARTVMGQNNVAASLGEIPTAGFTVFDVRGFWQVNNYLTLTSGVENIGDKFYREHLDPLAGNQFFRRGTNVYVTAQLRY